MFKRNNYNFTKFYDMLITVAIYGNYMTINIILICNIYIYMLFLNIIYIYIYIYIYIQMCVYMIVFN